MRTLDSSYQQTRSTPGNEPAQNLDPINVEAVVADPANM